MKICSIFAFTLCFIFSSTLGFAQRVKVSPGYKEYHVAVSGNDNNPGTLSSPYKTIMAAANKAIPDDVITIRWYLSRINRSAPQWQF